MKKYSQSIKTVAVGIILLFLGTCIIPAIAQETEKPLPASKGNTLYVGGSGPGNYTTIQAAVDNASDGDTVFVFDDSSPYDECIVVTKSLIIQGENKSTTIIDSGYFNISADHVTVTGFTIQNSETCLFIDYYGYNTISNNIIIYITPGYGIVVYGHDNIIIGNDVSQNKNNSQDQEYSPGIIVAGPNNNISYNTIHDNSVGICLTATNGTEIYRNTIKGNFDFGIFCINPSSDTIKQNNFLDNKKNVHVLRFITEGRFEPTIHLPILPAIFEGNYWDKSRILPYPIGGLFVVSLFVRLYVWHRLFGVETALKLFYNYSNFVRFDWHPAQEPYDIPEIS
jgi:parallel beta-helix repeat protein